MTAIPASTPPDWPGQRLGLPETGPRSVARLGRRFGALAIDWGIAVALSAAFFAYDSLVTLLLFVGLQALFTVVINASIGHAVLGMRVVPMAGGMLGVWRPIVRALLIALVIPALLFDENQRGLHDRAAGTVLLRR
ncbi:RDD family protein [Microcella humidisoli]|uniref:RDD family protein n=1 Tax=Microcella humidisoli TaxID=2963406 RepID=A0ABY5FVV6_9MICO|nr:RDD family protein [Microcella humidisoli]UTT62431.1 RDD family protein [Microcella humidisoli]